LAKLFEASAARYGGKLICADTDPLAPALFFAHAVAQLPPFRSVEFVPELVKLISQHQIGLIVPTLDAGLDVFALEQSQIEETGATVLISSSRMIEVCSDKWLTFQVFGEEGIQVPCSWLNTDELDSMPERLFVKPRIGGHASKGIHSTDKSNLHAVLKLVDQPIIQEHLVGDEVTIDALLDLDGQPIHFVPRKRIRTVGGESIEGVTIAGPEIQDWTIKVLESCQKLAARGPITIQCFLTKSGPVLTEINPRFGGGFPLAHAAGGHYTEWIMQMLAGDAVDACLGSYKSGLYMTRYYEDIFTSDPKW
jgi:carbamoyl-phosphate synthase large subunit